MELHVTRMIICCMVLLLTGFTQASVGTTCASTANCVTNSEVCTALVCACATNYGNDNGVCRGLLTTKSCSPSIAACSGTGCTPTTEECEAADALGDDNVRNCKCAAGYGDVSGTCTGLACTANGKECNGLTGAVCKSMTCTCGTGYTKSGAVCNTILGLTCTKNGNQCDDVTNAVCNGTPLKCSCDAGYTANGPACDADSSVNINRMSISVLLIVFLMTFLLKG